MLRTRVRRNTQPTQDSEGWVRDDYTSGVLFSHLVKDTPASKDPQSTAELHFSEQETDPVKKTPVKATAKAKNIEFSHPARTLGFGG